MSPYRKHKEQPWWGVVKMNREVGRLTNSLHSPHLYKYSLEQLLK